MAVLPGITAPAARSAVETWSLCSGTKSSYTSDPRVCRTPATMLRSLAGMGTPVSGGRAAGSLAPATAFSASPAWSRASSAVTV